MRIGTVIGKLELGAAAAGFGETDWVQIRLEAQTIVAADLMGVNPGQMVLLAEGDTAKRCRMDICADALVVAVLAEAGNNG